MTPRKLRLVADQIRGIRVKKAMVILSNLDKRAADPILAVLKQGIANAINNFNLSLDSLKVKSIEIGKGPIYKRWRFVGRGRIHQVQKKTGHIKMILEGEENKLKNKNEKVKKTTKK